MNERTKRNSRRTRLAYTDTHIVLHTLETNGVRIRNGGEKKKKLQMHTCRFGISAYETSRLTHFYISTLDDCCYSYIFDFKIKSVFLSWSNLNWSVERWNLRIINDSMKNYVSRMKNVNGSLSSIRRETGILRGFSWSFSIVITWL